MGYTKREMLDREFPQWRDAFEHLTCQEFVEAYTAHTGWPDHRGGYTALNTAAWLLLQEEQRRVIRREPTRDEIRASYGAMQKRRRV